MRVCRRASPCSRLEKGLPSFQPILGVQFRDRDGPALSFDRHQHGVPLVDGWRSNVQAKFPAGWRISRHRNDDGCVGDVHADLSHVGSAPAQGIQQRQCQRAAARRIHNKIGISHDRRSRVGADPDGWRRPAVGGSHDLHNPGTAPHQNVRQCLGAPAEHMLDQWPGRAEDRPAQIAPRQYAYVRALEPDVLREPDRNRSGADQVVLEAGIDLFKGLQPSRQQTVGVPVLGRADARPGGYRQIVAIEDFYLTEIWRHSARSCEPPDATADNHGTTKKVFHPVPLNSMGADKIGDWRYSPISSNG